MLKIKKVIGLVSAALLLVSIVGCGGQNNTRTSGGDAKYAVSDKPLTLTIFALDGLGPFNNDYPVFKKAAELTNVSLKGTIAKSVSDEAQAFNTMVSSGKLADIVLSYRTEFNKYGLEGAFSPLNELIDKHAPNIKKFLDANGDVKKYITAPDGNIYYIPFVPDGETGKAWFIRQDWLDKLGLREPKSADDFYNVLKAFKASNVNEKGGIVPYFSRLNTGGSQECVYDLFALWNAYPDWYADKDGKVKYGPIEPEFKTAVKNVAKWYQEGLIDSEIYTRGSSARDMFIGENTGGITHDWLASTATYNDKYKDSIQGLNFKVMAPPSGVEFSRRERLSTKGWGLSTQNANLVESIKYLDFFFNEEGRRLMNFGVEGSEYTMVNGKPTLTDKVLKADKPALDILRSVGAQLNAGYWQDFEYERQWMNKIADDGVNLYVQNNYIAPATLFLRTIEEDKRYALLFAPIESYRDENAQKWVLGGAADIDGAWDKYVNEFKRLNIDELISIQQAAYDRFK